MNESKQAMKQLSATRCRPVFMLFFRQQIYDFPVIIFKSFSYKLELVQNSFFLI